MRKLINKLFNRKRTFLFTYHFSKGDQQGNGSMVLTLNGSFNKEYYNEVFLYIKKNNEFDEIVITNIYEFEKE